MRIESGLPQVELANGFSAVSLRLIGQTGACLSPKDQSTLRFNILLLSSLLKYPLAMFIWAIGNKVRPFYKIFQFNLVTNFLSEKLSHSPNPGATVKNTSPYLSLPYSI